MLIYDVNCSQHIENFVDTGDLNFLQDLFEHSGYYTNDLEDQMSLKELIIFHGKTDEIYSKEELDFLHGITKKNYRIVSNNDLIVVLIKKDDTLKTPHTALTLQLIFEKAFSKSTMVIYFGIDKWIISFGIFDNDALENISFSDVCDISLFDPYFSNIYTLFTSSEKDYLDEIEDYILSERIKSEVSEKFFLNESNNLTDYINMIDNKRSLDKLIRQNPIEPESEKITEMREIISHMNFIENNVKLQLDKMLFMMDDPNENSTTPEISPNPILWDDDEFDLDNRFEGIDFEDPIKLLEAL